MTLNTNQDIMTHMDALPARLTKPVNPGGDVSSWRLESVSANGTPNFSGVIIHLILSGTDASEQERTIRATACVHDALTTASSDIKVELFWGHGPALAGLNLKPLELPLRALAARLAASWQGLAAQVNLTEQTDILHLKTGMMVNSIRANTTLN